MNQNKTFVLIVIFILLAALIFSYLAMHNFF